MESYPSRSHVPNGVANGEYTKRKWVDSGKCWFRHTICSSFDFKASFFRINLRQPKRQVQANSVTAAQGKISFSVRIGPSHSSSREGGRPRPNGNSSRAKREGDRDRERDRSERNRERAERERDRDRDRDNEESGRTRRPPPNLPGRITNPPPPPADSPASTTATSSLTNGTTTSSPAATTTSTYSATV